MFGRRHSDGIGLGNRIRTCPETLHLFVAHINAELCCFAVILIEEGAIFLHREVYEDGIPIYAGLINVAIAEISLHQIARYLVEERTVGKRLHNQGLSLNVNRVYRCVVGEDIDFFSQDLAVVTPRNGVAIEREKV